MPSRLGDDPLARAGSGTAKTSAESDVAASPVALDSFGGPATPQLEIQSDSNAAAVALQESYNDVFFLRRSEDKTPLVTSQVQQRIDEPVETREISEVSEIPEIRETAAAPVVGSERDVAAEEPSQPQAIAESADVQGTTAVESFDTVAPLETGEPVSPPAGQMEASIASNEGPLALPASFLDPSQSDGSQPDSNTGFFKKVFGRSGK